MRDDGVVRAACFAADVLQAKWGADVPHAALAEGFNYRGQRVPFLNRAYGIYRAAGVQRGPAALSVNSSPKQIAYQDEQTTSSSTASRATAAPLQPVAVKCCTRATCRSSTAPPASRFRPACRTL